MMEGEERKTDRKKLMLKVMDIRLLRFEEYAK